MYLIFGESDYRPLHVYPHVMIVADHVDMLHLVWLSDVSLGEGPLCNVDSTDE